jgi:hypothetical protein
MRRWTTLWLVALVVGTGLLGAAPAAAQYYDGNLPEGVVSVTCAGQPIDADTSPETDNRQPEIAGILDPGPTEVELALGDGEIVRFTVSVDPVSGAFAGTPPDPLDPGPYSLYIDDELIGECTIVGPETVPDLAVMVALPGDLGDGHAVVDGKLLSVTEEARRTAANSGDESPEAVAQLEQALTGTGWRRRYENRVALPQSEDPSQFQVLTNSFVIEYDSADNATASYQQVVGAGGEAIAGAATIGDQSTLARTEGTTTDTGEPFISLSLTFTVDRLLVNVAVSDLVGGEPDQATVEGVGAAVQQRIEAELAAERPGLSSGVLRLDLGSGITFETHEEGYERLDGALVPRYGEAPDQSTVREERFADADDAYIALFEGDAGGRFRHVVALYSFADEGAAAAWLAGVPERLRNDPLRGYLSMSPVEGAGEFGDGTAAYSFRHRAGGATTSGFRYYVQIGDRVAQIELATEGEAAQEAVETLVEQNVSCLEDEGFCAQTTSLPNGTGGDAAAEEEEPAVVEPTPAG